jgi:hypothetical protein
MERTQERLKGTKMDERDSQSLLKVQKRAFWGEETFSPQKAAVNLSFPFLGNDKLICRIKWFHGDACCALTLQIKLRRVRARG